MTVDWVGRGQIRFGDAARRQKKEGKEPSKYTTVYFSHGNFPLKAAYGSNRIVRMLSICASVIPHSVVR